ncbi:MAG TPA: hypothetical protein VEX86_18925 [Longimicrobium sp.]|nr:hypothetical protein [Longimicrobium sp.]
MKRGIVRTALAFAAAVMLAACGSDEIFLGVLQLQITPDREAYTAGSTATFAIKNLGTAAVQYSQCERVLQRQTSAGWVRVGSGDGACALVIHQLAPGGTVQMAAELPATLVPGTYRVYFPGFLYAQPDHISVDLETRKSSPPFQVTDPNWREAARHGGG